jgi:bifunctional DNA-binding transcriptional regulator/antitoxin component of YhaV-PrlF toxin-antitoxin module
MDKDFKGDIMVLKDKVLETVESFCNDLKSFTSLDISNYVKQHYPSVRHREIATIVRSLYTDGSLDSENYERSLIDVQISNGMMRDAYLYHHQTISPDDYDDRAQTAIPPVSSIPVVDNAQPTPVVDNAQPPTTYIHPIQSVSDAVKLKRHNAALKSWVTRRTMSNNTTAQVVPTPVVPDNAPNLNFVQERHNKSDGRLEIPIEWVRTLGWTEGQSIYVIFEDDKLYVESFDNVKSGDNILTTTCISGGRLRIPKTAFHQANFLYESNHKHKIEMLENEYITIEDDDTPNRPPTGPRTFCF